MLHIFFTQHFVFPNMHSRSLFSLLFFLRFSFERVQDLRMYVRRTYTAVTLFTTFQMILKYGRILALLVRREIAIQRNSPDSDIAPEKESLRVISLLDRVYFDLIEFVGRGKNSSNC